MITLIYIDAGSFHATVALDKLPVLPARSIRKLFRLMFRFGFENREAIDTLDTWLPDAVREAKFQWQVAQGTAHDNWQTVKKGSRKKEDVVKREKNRFLAEAVKTAKADYDAVIKIRSIFNEIKEKYYV